jgi:hypothetical protein
MLAEAEVGRGLHLVAVAVLVGTVAVAVAQIKAEVAEVAQSS